jgi:hypothetical protein
VVMVKWRWRDGDGKVKTKMMVASVRPEKVRICLNVGTSQLQQDVAKAGAMGHYATSL